MLIRRARRYRLEPTYEQEEILTRAAGCVRFVWNQALAIQKSYLEQKCGIVSYPDMAKHLTSWRNSAIRSFLAEGYVHSQQAALRHLDTALKNAFNKTSPKKFPVFKKRGLHDSIRFPDPELIKFDLKSIDSDGRNVFPKIYLPTIGWIKFRKSCIIGGEIRNATVIKSGGHWYVLVQIEKEIPDPVHPSTTTVGADRGVVKLLTLSDGTVFFPITAYRAMESKLAKEQRKLSKKIKFSANWKKQKAKLNKLHYKIAETRKVVLHQVSTILSKNHALVVLEDLKVQNMVKSAKGTAEKPGRKVKQKSGLNKAILDQAWGYFNIFLDYKLKQLGGMLYVVDPRYTSQTCSCCGVIDKTNRVSQSEYICSHCGYTANADVNAAKNILNIGLLELSTAGQVEVACSV